MKFIFTVRKADISDNLKKYTEKKLSKINRFFAKDSEADITFSLGKGGEHRVEVTIRSGGMTYRAQEISKDMYVSVDSVVNMLERQIRKNKTRIEKRLRSNSATIPEYFENPDEFVMDEDGYKVVKRKNFEMKPMALEDAILQMNMLGHAFYVFKNSEENDKTCVVYRRIDGDYGLIATE